MSTIRFFIKSILISFVAILLVFQPFLVPILFAADSWSGNSWEGDSWEGDSWEGDSWDGSDLKWEGESWSSDPWTGDATDVPGATEGVQPWSLEAWNESSFKGSTVQELPAWAAEGYAAGITWQYPGWAGAAYKGSGWNEQGFQGAHSSTGNGWSESGYLGDGIAAGNPWNQAGYQGSALGQGNPWMQSGYLGNGIATGNPWNQAGYQGTTIGPGSAYSGLPWASTGYLASGLSGGAGFEGASNPFYDSDGYQISEYVVRDIIGGQASFAGTAFEWQRNMDVGNRTFFDFGGRMYGDLLVNGFKLAGADNVFIDGYDAGSHVADGVKGLSDFKKEKSFGKSSSSALDDTLKKIPKPPAAVEKALSKLSIPGAVLGSVSSGAKTINSIASVAKNWDDSSGSEKVAGIAGAGENIGDFLMSTGVIASAIPGGQAVGGVMVAAGGAIWVVSRGVRAVAENWDKIKNSKVVKGATNLVKKGWKAITGLFGK